MMYCLISLTQLISLVSTSDISNAAQSLRCEFQFKSDNSCPVDGGWTSWNAWSSCTGNCGSKGKKTRSRSCNNPPPSNNGAPCIGPSYQIQSCQIMGCTTNDYEKIVYDHPVRKEEMKIIKAVHEKLPALIDLCFSIDCTFSLVKKILHDDAMVYWNAMNCVKYDVGCPVSGGWSHWEIWSACTAGCGKGQKYRTRSCDSPTPSDTELTCDGLAFETKDCTGVNCKKHSPGTWSNWSDWTACSVQCGNGIKIRKRSCSEVPSAQESSCEGPAKEIEACEINNCSVDGVWSSWTVWSMCSSNCGIGTQLRNRMCNNPSPSGNGAQCSGSASEVRQCFTKPCSIRSHEVVHFTGESSLFYTANGKPSRLLHVYLRFLPLAPFGVLLHRFQDNCEGPTCDFVRISLQNGKTVLLSQISGCMLGLIHEDRLEIGQWHVILAFIPGTYALLRVDNGSHKISFFSCIPVSQNLDHLMKVGEGFHGQIQEIAINFASIRLRLPKGASEKENEHVPYSSNYVQYLMGDDEEGFIHIALTESIAAPCPKKTEFWRITIAIRLDDINGIIAIIPGDSLHKYIILMMEDGRMKLQFYQGMVHTTVESTEHILIGEWCEIVLIQDGQNVYMQINGNEKNYAPLISEKTVIKCTDSIFIGAVRDEIKEKVCPRCAEIPQMSFTLGYLIIDGNQLDLLSLPALEVTSKRFSSRTISFSDYYEEVPLLLGQELKLSCFYDKIPREQRVRLVSSKVSYVAWLLMDKPLYSYGKRDDGRVSTVSAASYLARDAIENFYSCYIRHYKNKSLRGSGQALFTFGVTVIDENKEFEETPRKKWNSICVTIMMCFIFIIIWFLLEGIWDIRNSHGFYRLPRTVKDDDPTSIINFVLSTNGITLLGSQQAADEVVESVTEKSRIRERKVKKSVDITK